MKAAFVDYSTFCALGRDLKAVGREMLRVISIIVETVFNYLKTCICNVGSYLLHCTWYAWKAPSIPKGQDWVEISQTSECKGNPILLVHGWGGKPRNFYGLAENMRKTGCERPLYVIKLPNSHKESFKKSAEKVALVAEQILKQANAQKISLIGHSYGGVHVAKAACLNPLNIDQITTIASPMRGTKLATLPWLPAVTRKNLGYKADKLMQLNVELHEANIKIHHLVSGVDYMVFPNKAQRSKTSHTAYQYKGSRGHLGIVDDFATAKLLTQLHHQ